MNAYELLCQGAEGDTAQTLLELEQLRETRDPIALVNKEGRVLIVWTTGETYYAAGLHIGVGQDYQPLADWLVSCGVERSEAEGLTSKWPVEVPGVVMTF